jgi:hypothetical protein
MELLSTVLNYAVPFALGFSVVSVYAAKLMNLLKEVSGLIGTISVMLDDNKVTKEEIDAVVKEAKDIVNAVKAFGKTK